MNGQIWGYMAKLPCGRPRGVTAASLEGVLPWVKPKEELRLS